MLGNDDGAAVGTELAIELGIIDGEKEGTVDGMLLGRTCGVAVGTTDGTVLYTRVGVMLDNPLGEVDGAIQPGTKMKASKAETVNMVNTSLMSTTVVSSII